MLLSKKLLNNVIVEKISELNERVYVKSKIKQQPSLIVSKYLVKFKALDGEIHEFETRNYYHNYEGLIKQNDCVKFNNKTYPLKSICWYEISKLEETIKEMYFFTGFMLAPISEADIQKDEKLMAECKLKAKELGLL